MDEASWRALLRSVKKQKCTAFLGAGAAYPYLPLAQDVARKWASDSIAPYPFGDKSNLASVALYRSVMGDSPVGVKEDFGDLIKERQGRLMPDFSAPTEIHALLAELDMEVYLTTNYDDTLMQALIQKGKKPRRACCKWTRYLKDPDLYQSCFDEDPSYIPSVAEPLVYHFHGILEIPESMVLTEDDYTEFLISLRHEDILEPPILKVLTQHSLLFVGYSLRDWNLRVVFDTLTSKIGRQNRPVGVTVQIDPDKIQGVMLQRAKDYLARRMNVWFNLAIYWGSADAFVADLRRRLGPPAAPGIELSHWPVALVKSLLDPLDGPEDSDFDGPPGGGIPPAPRPGLGLRGAP